MVKRARICITLLLLLLFCLGGCGKSDELRIVQDINLWQIADTPIQNIAKDAWYIGKTDNGVYYCEDLQRIYFQDWDGEVELLHEEVQTMSYASCAMSGENAMICIADTEGLRILLLSEGEQAEILLEQNAVQRPYIYSCEEKVFFILNNWNENMEFCNSLVVWDKDTDTTEVLYDTIEKATVGEDLRCVGGDTEILYFCTRKYDALHTEYWLHQYSFEEERVIAEYPIERAMTSITGDGKFVFASETEDIEYLEEAGWIGELSEGTILNKQVMPYISSSNLIYNTCQSEDGVMLRGPFSGYFWDYKASTIYAVDFLNYMDLENAPAGEILGASVSEKDFSWLINKEDGIYLRTLKLEKESR